MEEEQEEFLDAQDQEESEEDTSNESQEESEDNGESDEGKSEETDYKALYEKEKQEKEKERTMRQGMVKKLQALTSPKKSQPKTEPAPVIQDNDRLDKLELRQIDQNLTADEIKEILLTKKTRGLSDAVEAYNLPMVQSWLKDSRAKAEQKEKIEKAIPKTQSGSSSSPKARESVNSSGRGSNLQEVAAILEREILNS